MKTVLSALLALGVLASAACAEPLPFTGVNLASGEFYGPKPDVRPIYGKNFIYPGVAEYAYFAWHGANVFRVPFLWETIQPQANGDLDPEMLGHLKDAVKLATDKGLVVELDPHNYARYYGKVLGTPEAPAAMFADFWAKLATAFKDDPRVWFQLVNEPHGISAAAWFDVANEAVQAIRKTGATNLILLPGTAYSGAHSWQSDWYGGANAASVTKVKDPIDHMVIEVHQYLDGDSSGTKPEIKSPTIGSERLRGFVAWCRANKYRAFLGEFAVPASEAGKVALEDMLASMEADRDVWLGWTWWAAGAWWPDNYMFSLKPTGGDKAQTKWLVPHLRGREAATVKLALDGAASSGPAVCGTRLTLKAGPAPAGKTFAKWTGDVAFLADATKAETTLTVPYRDLSLKVTWR